MRSSRGGPAPGPDSYYDGEYDGPQQPQYFLDQGYQQPPQTEYTHSRYYVEDEPPANGDRRRSIDDDRRSEASSRRSHATSHRSRRTTRTASQSVVPSRAPPPPLSESNLRALTEVSATTASSRVPRGSAVASPYRAPYAETAATPRGDALNTNMELQRMTRPPLVHAATAPLLDRAMSELTLAGSKSKKKKEIDMDLAYGNVPPDLATRTDLGPVTPAEEEDARWREEMKKEEDARKLMGRIDALLDEAQCVQHTATSIIEHLQQKPEAAAAVALLLAELSTLIKTMSPGFLGIVKGGFPAIFALLASPQFLIAVGVAVGVTVISFGGWKIVKRMKEAKAIAAEREAGAQAFEMQQQPSIPDGQSAFQAGANYGPPGPGSYDDALVLDEELSTIESWRRGITPSIADDESVDLELITPSAVKSVRGDAMSIRTTRTHRSSKSHRSHRSHKPGDDVEVPSRVSSRAQTSRTADTESEAGSERSHRSSRSKTTVRTRTTKAIDDGSREEDNTVEALLRPKEKKSSMLKTLFKKKKDKEEERESAVSVMA